MEHNLLMLCLSQVEIFQYKHLQDFVEIVDSGFVKVFFCVLHGMPYCRKRGWNQMQDWNPYKKESENGCIFVAAFLSQTKIRALLP